MLFFFRVFACLDGYNCWPSCGYITDQTRGAFFEWMDAANFDLKAFTDEFYQHRTLPHLQPVLDRLKWLHDESIVWFEITNLVIPGENDSPMNFTACVIGSWITLSETFQSTSPVSTPIFALVVGVAIGEASREDCRRLENSLAAAWNERRSNTLLVISSDMNHFAKDAETWRLDSLALDALEAMHADRLLKTTRDHKISMCGMLPACIV